MLLIDEIRKALKAVKAVGPRKIAVMMLRIDASEICRSIAAIEMLPVEEPQMREQ